MVLRILPGSGDTLRLEQLGYDSIHLKSIHELASRPSGLVVMAGGVGSGKSTSIVGILHAELEMHQSRLRIITVEDPPEREIPGATQVPVVRKRGTAAGDEFSFAIRGALRCDPDTLMVGEVRDLQSAVLAIKFAQSGHRVYTTIHASTALGIIGRLVGLGVDSTLLCMPDVLKGLVFQTLVPQLCPSCKIPTNEWLHEDPTDTARRKEITDRATIALKTRGYEPTSAAHRSSSGCRECGFSGVSGRTLMAEITQPDDDMLLYLSRGDYISAKRHWIENLSGQPVEEHGISLMATGTVSPSDVEWRIGHLLPVADVRDVNGSTKFPSADLSGNLKLVQEPGHA